MRTGAEGYVHSYTSVRPDIRGAPLLCAYEDVPAPDAAVSWIRELFQRKHRTLELMLGQLGFAVFDTEASWSAVQVVEDHVQGAALEVPRMIVAPSLAAHIAPLPVDSPRRTFPALPDQVRYATPAAISDLVSRLDTERDPYVRADVLDVLVFVDTTTSSRPWRASGEDRHDPTCAHAAAPITSPPIRWPLGSLTAYVPR
jgi:hypothetical protein